MEKEGWYWDGGLSSNLPLSQVINLLEQCDGGDPDVERELIIVELFPMRAQVPTNLIEVQNRMSQLLFSSKLKLDRKLFDKTNSYIDLMQRIDKVLPQESELRKHPAYNELMSHRKINSSIVITSTRPESLTGASNFSKATIENRIECGYQDAFSKLDKLGLIPL
jgi:NTE family protein